MDVRAIGEGDIVTSPASGAAVPPAVPDYAPVPRSSLGPALNDQGYYVGRVERNLFWVTDGTYQPAVPMYNLNLSEDAPGYIQAPATALSYPWKTYIGGHLARLCTRDDIILHQQYWTTAFAIMQSIRLDQGPSSPIHP
jgi:hypothetical protein